MLISFHQHIKLIKKQKTRNYTANEDERNTLNTAAAQNLIYHDCKARKRMSLAFFLSILQFVFIHFFDDFYAIVIESALGE